MLWYSWSHINYKTTSPFFWLHSPYLSQSIWSKFKFIHPHVIAPSTCTWQPDTRRWTALQMASAGSKRPPTFDRWENVTNFVLSLTHFMNSFTIWSSVVAPLKSEGTVLMQNGRCAWRINQALPFVPWFCPQITTLKTTDAPFEKVQCLICYYAM